MSQLRVRLENCIRTILDLENGIREKHTDIFDTEFVTLKDYLTRLDQLNLAEDDVTELEKITAHFLTELGRNTIWQKSCNLLQ